ncbi:Response regulator PleD [Lignipirellula cremea]|uniref:diguanylate cyclase n=2 Tax=Lignipirellula cremea TaxID=2528010 RepID=A0A518E3P1_9BACT|nr:Response regulator PleD [Lignipirellula cremea]
MNRLGDLTASVAANVDQHSTRMRAINDELAASKYANPEKVVDAVTHLIQCNEEMQKKLAVANARLSDQQRELESRTNEARTDALTKLNNRRAFDDEMNRCRDEFQRRARPSSVLMLDVDHFKKFNDTHGHQAGDEVLKMVGRTLKGAVTCEQVVCRYGGEEFAIIFPGYTAQEAALLADKARSAIAEQPLEFDGKTLRVAASGGLAEFLPQEDGAAVVKRADQALYEAKKNGRNCGFWNNGQQNIKLAAEPKEVPAPVKEPVAEEPTVPAIQNRDPVTGLSNREAFIDDLSRRLAEWRRGGTVMSVIELKVDNYDQLIEKQGAAVGKVLLRTATQFLNAAMREMDHIGRTDEDRFGVLLPTAKLGDACNVADRLRSAIARCKLPLGKGQLQFTVSLGVVESRREETAEQLMLRVKEASNYASQQGGNCTCHHVGEKLVKATIQEATASPR